MSMIAVAVSLISSAQEKTAEESYLLRAAKTLELCRADLAAMRPVAEQAADRLIDGGKLWASGQPSMVSEISGRAGGIMMLRDLAGQTPGDGDVVLHTPEPGTPEPEALLESKALVIVFGRCAEKTASPCLANHAEDFGLSPTLANAFPAWIFTGELIAALTRRGKMPVIYESIGAYGGHARIAQYKSGDIAFHDDKTVPPVAAGWAGNQFIDKVCAMLRRVESEERGLFDRAGEWGRESRAQGKQRFMYSMGHLFPDEIGRTDIGKVFKSAVWNAGFRMAYPDDKYDAGDFIVHIGYQHPPDTLLRKAVPGGARVVYVSVRPDRDFMKNPGAIWIDPMWDWPDACVFVEGYDVPWLAASGIVNGAIAWEIHRLTMQSGGRLNEE